MNRPQRAQALPGEPRDHQVVIPASLTGVLLSYFSEAGEHERGGVLLGRRDEAATWVSGALFPPQLLRDRGACSFDVGYLNVIHTARDMLEGELAERVGTIVGWIHSHPGHGLFLSQTDVATLSAWRQLDSRAVAVVADPFQRGRMSERIAWWGGPGPAHYLTLDESQGAILTIQQVAKVAEALSQSAGPEGRWDIVTARTVVRIMSNQDSPTRPAAVADADPLQAQGRRPRSGPTRQPRPGAGRDDE